MSRFKSSRVIKFRQDATGFRFGLLVVLGMASTGRSTKWDCQCDCGNRSVVRTTDLNNGSTLSCGCFSKSKAITHGATAAGKKHPEYTVWSAMKARCHNPLNKRYHDWGGRGIVVCSEWRSDYGAFISHVGRRPSSRHQIDRIDNARGYEPGNCRWVLPSENCRNTRRSRIVVLWGIAAPLVAWADSFSIEYHTAKKRLNRGDVPARAFRVENEAVAWG